MPGGGRAWGHQMDASKYTGRCSRKLFHFREDMFMYISVYVCVCTSICVYVHIVVCIFVYVCMHKCMCGYPCVHAYGGMYICVYMCVCVSVYVDICEYEHICCCSVVVMSDSPTSCTVAQHQFPLPSLSPRCCSNSCALGH